MIRRTPLSHPLAAFVATACALLSLSIPLAECHLSQPRQATLPQRIPAILRRPASGASVRASAGCGKSHFLNGITQYRGVKSGNRDRSYSIHAPSSYDKNKPYPVVLGFHGSGSIGFFFEVDTRMSEAQFSGEKIMVYPNGVDGNWAGPSYATATVAEDLQFVTDLLNDVKSNFCVDTSKVYATGMSNGGGFVGTLACSAEGGQFAAFAPASGSFYTDLNGPDNGCAPARSPLPILEIHGGNDKSVNYTGGKGEGGQEPPIADWLDWWATRNKCTDETQDDSFDGDVHHLSWTCNGTAGVLQHYKVDDMGHAWASTEPNFSQLAAGEGPTHIQASSIIMAFFDQFVLP